MLIVLESCCHVRVFYDDEYGFGAISIREFGFDASIQIKLQRPGLVRAISSFRVHVPSEYPDDLR